jgi:plastocyanin
MDEPQNQAPAPIPVTSKNKKRSYIVALVLLLIVGLAAVLLTNRNSDSVDLQALEPVPTGAVSVTEEGFSPATIQIKKGESVTWTNVSGGVHQIASDPHPVHDNLPGLFSEEALQPDDSFTYQFEDSGTFTYHDHLNPFTFQGIVIVE